MFNRRFPSSLLFLIIFLCVQSAKAQERYSPAPGENAKPWVIWYWMQTAASQAGIRADLLAMKQQNLGGAYMMFIQDTPDSALYRPPARQLSPQWWKLVKYAANFADSIHFKLALHISDGFATSGGPWIKPEMSMQKVVWSELNIRGNRLVSEKLPQPPILENYYKDIAIYAFPTPEDEIESTFSHRPVITTSTGEKASFLIDTFNTKNFSSTQPCWIQYAFDQPFTCRTIKIRTKGITFQAKRLRISVSNDGSHFRFVEQLKPARSGWEDYLEDNTYSIPATTAKYFRFEYDPEGTEPGSEDLDAAKWKPSLKICGLELYGGARINLIEGKNGSIWRISDRSTADAIPDSVCVPLDKILNITSFVDANGMLHWRAPKGNWTVLRMGHTTTGMQNETAGGAKGLECDKFNPSAVKLQFNEWFNRIYDSIGPEVSKRVLKVFHTDSWEAGSQNWSPVFVAEFKKRRGYDPLPYLPAMAGIPVESAGVSERFLFDVRNTIADLIADNFFGTLKQLAHDKDCIIDAESVAPTMVSDGMLHYKNVDLPMGEFWLNSPTHDKPNDILDAVSAGHIYGKRIIAAESFTELRNRWNEYPGMLKTLQDRNYTMGINKNVFHVFVENPWLDRNPGMTLGGVGLFFQREQTWWKPAKAWIAYTERCQRLLQQGHSVNDIAVFTGEEIPRRAVLPDRLVNTLPGIFGKDKVNAEKLRLENKGNPLQHIPEGVTSSANITTPADWVNALNGYQYDSFNKDAFLRLMRVRDGKIILPGGAEYKILVFPDLKKMNPNDHLMSTAVAEKILEFVKQGATILLDQFPTATPGLLDRETNDAQLGKITRTLLGNVEDASNHDFSIRHIGKGKLLIGAYPLSDFDTVGVSRDLIIKNEDGSKAEKIAWTHRRSGEKEIYFLSNQEDSARWIRVAFSVKNKLPKLYDAVSDTWQDAKEWQCKDDYTSLKLRLDANASLFVVFEDATKALHENKGNNWLTYKDILPIKGSWKVSFYLKNKKETFLFPELTDWTKRRENSLKYYSGTATYQKNFVLQHLPDKNKIVWLSLGEVKNMASVKLNGVDCGVVWTYPYKVDITKALKRGNNQLEIDVTNTWANRLLGDSQLPAKERTTWTIAPFYLSGHHPLSAGLLGTVVVQVSE